MGYKIIGLLEDNKVEEGILEKYPVLGKFSDAEQVISKYNIQHVFIAALGLEQGNLTKLIYKIQALIKSMDVIPNLVGVQMGGIICFADDLLPAAQDLWYVPAWML